MPSALEYISESFPYNLVDYTMPLSVRGPLKREGWSRIKAYSGLAESQEQGSQR